MNLEASLQRVRQDVREVLDHFPLSAIEHLLANRHRLVRRVYRHREKGCFFNLLSETLPLDRYIRSKPSLMRFFTGSIDLATNHHPVYQAPRWLVRLIDGHSCPRYGGMNYIDYDKLLEFVEEVAVERRSQEAESRAVERQALQRCQNSIEASPQETA